VPRAGGPDPLDRPYRRATSIPPADPRELPRWNRLPWWRKAAVCCAQPTVFYGLMFAAMGALFLVGALVLDPRMAPIGLLLIAVALVMVVAYFILAYRAFGGRPRDRRQR
jgi:membrane protein implicated in regulation of membrane protease activity